MNLNTERLTLRRFTPDDWMDLYEYLSNDLAVKYEPYGVFTEEACEKEAARRSKDDAFWAAVLKENNRVIGNIYFQQQQPREFMTWEIGYVFNPAFWGKGYAAEAARRVLQYGFGELGAHRIMARCNPENIASRRLLERMSMRREGHFRKPAFFKRSHDNLPLWHDAYEYAILEEEWFLMKSEAGEG